MEVHTEQAKVVEGKQPQQIEQTTEKKPEQDLITRVSQVKKEEEVKPTEQTTQQVSEPEFDFKDIDKITDPTAKKYAEDAYKSFQRGFNSKFQEIADLRKSLEKQQADNSVWSPQRVQGLLNNPDFVKSAQEVMKNQAPPNFEGTQEEWSGLTEQDKAKFQQFEQKLNLLEQQNFQARRVQEDESLKNKYGNYNPEAVDIITRDLLEQKVMAGREHLWKVLDYEDAVKRAYELGKRDERETKKEKLSSVSAEGITTTASGEGFTKGEKESNMDFFRRIFLTNKEKSKKTT